MSEGQKKLTRCGVSVSLIAVLAVVGALLIGFLAALAHGLGGVVGLVVWGCASLALGIVGSQWAVKGSAGSGA